MQSWTTERRPSFVRRIVDGWTRRFAEPKPVPRNVLLTEIGIPGGVLDEDGLTVEDYNPNLYGRPWFEKVDEMLVASSQAAVVELCWCLPVVSTEWEVVGGSTELNALCADALFSPSGMSTTWPEVAYQAAMSALYGTSFFELVWKEVEGALTLRRLVDRDQTSIDRYEWDPDGGLRGVVQVGADPDHPDEEIEVFLPIEKCLLLPYRGRRRELHGRSVLRPAYSHYYTLDMVVRFANIGLDHSLVGTPVGRAPANAKPSDQAKFLSILRALRRHEASGVVLPPGWDLVDSKTLSAGGDSVGFLDYIQWHEGCFLRAALSSYMQLGSTATGTKEVSSDLIRVQMMGLQALADGIASRITRHVLRRICDANAQGLAEEAYPELVCQPIADLFRDGQAQQFVGALRDGAVAVPADRPGQEALVREGLGLTTDSRAEGAPVTDVGARQTDGGQPQAAEPAQIQARESGTERRRQFAAARVDEWQAVMERQLDAVLADLLAQVEAAEGPEHIVSLAVSPAQVWAWGELVADWLAAARVAAVMVMARETGRLVPGSDDPRPTAEEVGRGQIVAQHLADEARMEVQMAALEGAAPAEIGRRFAEQVSSVLASDLRAGGQRAAATASTLAGADDAAG